MALDKVKKPSAATARKLAQLYPSSKHVPVKRLRFDPMQECIALPAKKAKKAARIKPVTLEIVVPPTSQSLVLPRGKHRQHLASRGRVKNIQFKRTMSPVQIKNVICTNFGFKVIGIP